MKIIRKLVFLGMVSLFCSSAYSADPTKEIEKKVAALNTQAFKLLGISLNALGYLVDADPNHYLLLSHLEQSGEIKFIRELERKGYVKTQKVKALPDGTQSNDEFLRVIPIGQGVELQRCVVALKHNTNLQPTQ